MGNELKEIDKNPYTACGNKDTKRSIVTFTDILGYQSYVLKYKELTINQKLERLRGCIANSYKHAKDNIIPAETDSQRYWETKTFSDNISIFYPVRDEVIVDPSKPTCEDKEMLGLFHVTLLMAYLQLEMVRSGGFFIRGGISIGDAFVAEDMVYSDGLIEAYKAESKQAKNPRVIFSTSAAKVIRRFIKKMKEGQEIFLHGIAKDEDSKFYVNYLSFLDDKGEFSQAEYLEMHKGQIIYQLEMNRGKVNNIKKYSWSAKYHNEYCKSVKREELMIPGEMI